MFSITASLNLALFFEHPEYLILEKLLQVFQYESRSHVEITIF